MSKMPTEAEIDADYDAALKAVIEEVGPDDPALHFLNREYRREWFVSSFAERHA